MKRIYTYGHEQVQRNLTIGDIVENKKKGVKMTQVTAQNREEAEILSEQNIDMIITGSDTYEDVRNGAPNTFITAALFAGRFITKDDILKGAIEVAMKGADSVLTPRSPEIVEMLANEGMHVQGHVGMVPSDATKFGGIRTVGKTVNEALEILKDLKDLENAGAFGAEVECVAEDALIEISKHTDLVLNSLGAGSGGDVIFLFFEDIVGETKNIKMPRHAKSWGDGKKILNELKLERSEAISAFKNDVDNSKYPNSDYTISMDDGELDKFINELKEG
ncbi:3-methyl-2-oxobutanoate hydroxymethyltransferase [Acidimicrobiaceae bacterium]|nr:3-methyl-2-oxobutanoate hydroxymethyltransferase [Acidimicrobiaceae bacterium]